ncbi:MAG TPA: hypothetical protein VE404_09475 [Verrucomicrobiae bacterium]|nr:hypothetical protein [Verrucomicrobiae bacterium]
MHLLPLGARDGRRVVVLGAAPGASRLIGTLSFVAIHAVHDSM